MLKPEAAKQQLEQWQVSSDDGDDAADRCAPAIRKLPAALRTIAFGVVDRDASGNERKELDYDEGKAAQLKAARDFDALRPEERKKIFAAFLPRLAEQLERAWQARKSAPYQTGWARKSFRAPKSAAATVPARLDWLEGLLRTAGSYRGDVVTAAWLAAWAPHLCADYRANPDDIGRLLAAVIDAGGAEGNEVFDILTQSARNEHEIGAMGRHVTRALLGCARQDGWELMEKMLLAAQRQEGLRQTILETVDEAHPQAFRRMLKLIQEHDLARFSSVVRAVDVWFGYQWDSISAKVVNEVIDKVLRFLDDDSARAKALAGKDAEDAYLALWSIAFDDALASLAPAAKLLKHAKVEHRYAAALFLTQLRLPQAQEHRLPALDDPDLRVACVALTGLMSAVDEDEPEELRAGDDLFERLERLYARFPEKPTNLKPLVWPWTGVRVERGLVAGQLTNALGDRPPTRLIPYLSALDTWSRRGVIEHLAKQKKWDKLTRDALLDLAGDSSADVREAAYKALANATLQPAEATRLEGYLNRKSADLRRGAIGLLAKQKDKEALASAERLLASKDGNQRLAGLELVRQLAEANRERAACQQHAEAYRAGRKQLNKEEQTQLDAIENSDREIITLDNALGLLDPSQLSPVVEPTDRKAVFITAAAIECIKSLDALIHQHREMPVPADADSGRTEETPLGALPYGFGWVDWMNRPEALSVKLPLRELWEQWREQRPAKLRDADGCELLRAFFWTELNEWEWESWNDWAKGSSARKKIAEKLSGGQKPVKGVRYERLVSSVLGWLVFLDPPPKGVDFALDAVETSFALVPGEMREQLANLPDESDDGYESDDEPDWRAAEPLSFWHLLERRVLGLATVKSAAQRKRDWQLMHWLDRPVPGAKRMRPGLPVLREAHAHGLVTTADWYDQLLGPRPENSYGNTFDDLRAFTQSRLEKEDAAFLQAHPEIAQVVERCRERVLEIELARGEEATPATAPALEMQSVHGVDTLLRVLTALGKQPFKSETYWGGRHTNRAPTLTHLAQISYPKTGDTPDDFATKVKAAVAAGQVPEERILQLAFLAPQWARHVETFFGWPGFREGLYWFLAHMNYVYQAAERAAGAEGIEDSGESEGDGEKPSAWERLIRERTPLTESERGDGAVDVAWFRKTFDQLSPKRWQAMAEAARFAANSSQARRAQFIADVLLGTASRKELIAGIRTKKLKDYVRLFGLLPLADGAKRDADLMERYRILQEYRRYAKTLSAMTKEGAMRAVEIGMQNLARTAGYPDPLRLEWAMEADGVKDLAKGPVSATRDGVTVTLALDERAAPQLTVRRGDKELKSIPPEIKKKDKAIAALAERVTDLKRQSSRMRQSLEIAMCRGDAFSAAELQQLCGHAILKPQLERLVLIGDGAMGYPDKGGKALRDHRGKLEPVKKTESLRVAHPFDLYQSGQWDAWQRECFAAERVQPFKQVFRELYLVTKQEKADRDKSRRYAGQQVNPKQAFALWGQRGWSTNDGVAKTFHDVGLTAVVNFNYGVTTPLEVEGLTLESIQFRPRDKYEPLKLTDVPPRVFSEVMRDLDLVVSVAHRGGVDPEASASTVEMRANLLRETCQLLKLRNVRFKNHHALVDGELGNYSVHLGSATVHRMPGGALCIVPVHAQHRGRLFLPFADDDPKTAEVISKVMLLARDAEIQDPTIREQLMRG